MSAIKAIETWYRGYLFRSRTEARWAVFFDSLGVKWEYEPEGFDLGDAGWYLPDFRITYTNGEVIWCEVKGDVKAIPGAEWEKMEKFGSGSWLLLLDQVPRARAYLQVGAWGYRRGEDVVEYKRKTLLGEINDSWRFGVILWPGEWGPERNTYGHHIVQMPMYGPSDDSVCDEDSVRGRRMTRAVASARSARFEHGQSGASY